MPVVDGAFRRLFSDIVADTVTMALDRCPEPGGLDMEGPMIAVVIEDDEDIRGLLSTVLEQAGFAVHAAGNGLDGVELVREHDPIVTTLDVSMPGIDGFETAKRIRAISATYIVMLTARDDEIDTLQGLQAGADDYLTKPFRPRELRARVEAMLRRPRAVIGAAEGGAIAAPAAPGASSAQLSHSGLVVDVETRIVTSDGEEVELTRSEFDILAELMRAGRRVVNKNDLVLVVRGDQQVGTYVSDHDVRAIEVHVGNLRRKLGESVTSPRWIETIRGLGYRMTAG
jgi:two-component system OmpR family response regulator